MCIHTVPTNDNKQHNLPTHPQDARNILCENSLEMKQKKSFFFPCPRSIMSTMSMNWLCKFFMEGGASACRNGEKVCHLSARACVWVGCLSLCYKPDTIREGQEKINRAGEQKTQRESQRKDCVNFFLLSVFFFPPFPGVRERKREREGERDICTCCFGVRV